MKAMLFAATALALLGAPALAADQSNSGAAAGASNAGAANSTKADRVDLATWRQRDLYSGWSVEELLDADVYDAQGEEIGEVEDVIIGPDGKVRSLVIEAGGFLDIGDTHFAYPWAKATIQGTDRVTVAFDKDRIADYSIFRDMDDRPTQGRNWRVTELINDYAYLSGRQGYGMVDDVIISRQGEVQAVIVRPDIGYGVSGAYAWPYYGYGYGFDPTYDYYEVPYDRNEVAGLEPFDYNRLEQRAAAD